MRNYEIYIDKFDWTPYLLSWSTDEPIRLEDQKAITPKGVGQELQGEATDTKGQAGVDETEHN